MTDETSKRNHLPGIDTAPDVYETGNDIDDDTTNSTLQTSQSGAESAHSGSETSEEEDDDYYGISRRRLYPERARSRFDQQSRGVRADGVDLSDRVDGRRKGYKVRRRNYGEEEDESLEAKIARLRRELEECKAEAKKEREAAQEGGEDGDDDVAEDVDDLSRMLAQIDVHTPSSSAKRGHRRKRSVFHDAPTTATQQHADDSPDDQILPQISAFDTRLAALESALGVSSILDPTATTDTLSTPLLPTLTLLDQQLSTLTSATSLTALETASSRISQLKSESQHLSSLSNLSAEGVEESDPTPLLSPQDLQTLHSLYALLPTLQNLTPIVPALTTRLRSLHSLHTAAAQASSDLESVEQRQAEMERELKMWRDGLEKVEEAVRRADEANGKNGMKVREWVEELDGRVRALGR